VAVVAVAVAEETLSSQVEELEQLEIFVEPLTQDQSVRFPDTLSIKESELHTCNQA
jgi:hypothetical protein